MEPNLNQGGGFVAEFNPAGSALLFSSLIGGTDGVGALAVTGLAVGAPGNIYIAGYTGDTTLPTTPGAFQTSLKNPGTGNSYDGYIGKIGVPEPTITEVANAESQAPTITPNTWVSIYGSNLAKAGDSRSWQVSDFVNSQLPTNLDGVSVTVNGTPAYVSYISPTQINVLTPPGALSGSVPVVVTYGVPSAAFNVPAQAGSPAFFVFNGGSYVAATHANGSLIGPATLYPGSSTPAAPGETIVIYGNGFGATSTAVTAGAEMQFGTLSPLPLFTIGGVSAQVLFAGLNVTPGEFQFNVVVPSSLANGDQPVNATYNGLTTQAGTRWK